MKERFLITEKEASELYIHSFIVISAGDEFFTVSQIDNENISFPEMCQMIKNLKKVDTLTFYKYITRN